MEVTLEQLNHLKLPLKTLEIAFQRRLSEPPFVKSWIRPRAGVAYLPYTVLTSPNKGETAVHCCDPALSVLVMLVSRNVFRVSALQFIVSKETRPIR